MNTPRPSSLIVHTHPAAESLVRSVAQRIGDQILAHDPNQPIHFADLAAEGFDPRFTVGDQALYHQVSTAPADVAREQARINQVTDLVLVFPVYWWSMPALLKGWVDRVFSHGWAFELDADGKIVKKLQHLRIHIVGIAASDQDGFDRHGYTQSFQKQIAEGIVGYCGALLGYSGLIFGSESVPAQNHLSQASDIAGFITATQR